MKILKRVLLGLVVVTVLLSLVFVVWANDAYQPDELALDALSSDAQVVVRQQDGYISFEPVQMQSGTAFVFYPGGRVDYRAYAAPLHQIASQGYLVVLLQAPLNLAFFDANAAEQVFVDYPYIENWVVGGHSLGGSMAAAFAASHDDVNGLVLWASYPPDDALKSKNIKILSIYGTLDMAGMDTLDEKRALLPSSTEFVVIDGANHSQFGNYGFQSGDNEATISRADQQKQVVDATVMFLESLER